MNPRLLTLLQKLSPLRKPVGVIGALLALATAVAAYFAFFVTHEGAGGTTDGFGRALSESPTLMRWLLEQGRLWAGWLWFFTDLAALLIGGLGGASLAMWGFMPSSPQPPQSPQSPSNKPAPATKPAPKTDAKPAPKADAKPAPATKPAPPKRVQR